MPLASLRTTPDGSRIHDRPQPRPRFLRFRQQQRVRPHRFKSPDESATDRQQQDNLHNITRPAQSCLPSPAASDKMSE